MLVHQGRSTLQELADGIRLGPSATRERVRGLESSGIVTGYQAVVDEAQLGFPVDALVEVDLALGVDEVAFAETLTAMPEVVEVLHATGEHDYLIRLRCRDTNELHGVVRGTPPWMDLAVEKSVQTACLRAIREGIVSSAHDLAEGGLAVALAESCISGPGEPLGAEIELEASM